MDRGARLNVVDRPISWHAPSAGPGDGGKRNILPLRSPLCESAGGSLLKTMPVYGDDSPYGHHAPFFGKMTSHLPAILFSRIRAWEENPRFIDVNRHSFEMTLNR